VLIKYGIGIVRYIGPLQGYKKKPDEVFVGVELKEPNSKGKNDGTALGQRYFQCAEKRGVFIKHIKKILEPEKILEKLAETVHQQKTNKKLRENMMQEAAALRVEKNELTEKCMQLEKLVQITSEGTYNSLPANEPPYGVAFSDPGVPNKKGPPTEYVPPEVGKGSPHDSMDSHEKAALAAFGGEDPNESTVPTMRNLGTKSRSDELSPNPMSRAVTAPVIGASKPRDTKRGKHLFRAESENFWEAKDAEDLQNDLRGEVEKMRKEQALQAISLPDFNAPDKDFVDWLDSGLSKFCMMDHSFSKPDLKNPPVLKALVTVSRMLASLTQSTMQPRASSVA